jgi:hypothetical protein
VLTGEELPARSDGASHVADVQGLSASSRCIALTANRIIFSSQTILVFPGPDSGASLAAPTTIRQ